MKSHTSTFKNRHIGISQNDLPEMLKKIGVNNLDQLITETVPKSIRLTHQPNLPNPLSEAEYLQEIATVAAQNTIAKSYIGQGYYNTFTPSVILRNLFENPGWYTQYTPYQAEISQGRLESLLNFQTMICDLTQMDIANASLLDEGTAASEAMTLLHRVRTDTKKTADLFYVSDTCYPQTIAVLQARAQAIGIQVQVGTIETLNLENPSLYGILLQYPAQDGSILTYKDLVKKAHGKEITVAVATDLLSLTLLSPPGEWDADVVFGNSQRFGVPLGFGGPHAAFFATKDAFKRQLPGRIIGISIDKHGNKAYRMSLQTREQHIRRDKATSNICTAQALLANMAAMYAIYHGPNGLKEIAKTIQGLTSTLAKSLEDLGFQLKNKTYFDTLTILLTDDQKNKIIQSATQKNINLRQDHKDEISISLDETTTQKDCDHIITLFRAAAIQTDPIQAIFSFAQPKPNQGTPRITPFLTQPVFNQHHSETQMMRYLHHLEQKDLALNTSMIPLGSCTMKLNAATEMIPVTWPQFGQIHPFAPQEQTQGYTTLFRELETMLSEITGFAATSLQPNSGAQGELAGLLVIKTYFKNKNQGHRNIVLIPSSAHGTNPATASMAGLTIVVVNCDTNGNIDIEDLKTKAHTHNKNLAALMITYPSTHGVFEETIIDICNIIHENGGQVYMDGANMNAQVGLTSPGRIGADVCHLNLHKTFCIPHGGGGPGVGPICVAKHLAPYLPGHPATTVSSAPYGSASILLISYAYIKMMGSAGLKAATEYAILNANYIKARLQDHYPILYTGTNGHVAHELILDCRAFKKTVGIEVEDIAKRLMDYGFHAPTMSWPVPGTLMIEPTESEDKAELDRFCDAMIAIRNEIGELETGFSDRKDNVLKNAPHTAKEVTGDTWEHKYTRQKAAYPLPYVSENKFWPSVSRIDNAYGDRNIMCTCDFEWKAESLDKATSVLTN
ncbi:MAG: glycine dehydrogenase (aminomethyl-transferring) [Candidatus Margulisbacteria bacterium]|nr:glycine dehydrogenase (aminomethyl-transferring) [Candidatus Margulisiibacteriota bacterium]